MHCKLSVVKFNIWIDEISKIQRNLQLSRKYLKNCSLQDVLSEYTLTEYVCSHSLTADKCLTVGVMFSYTYCGVQHGLCVNMIVSLLLTTHGTQM